MRRILSFVIPAFFGLLIFLSSSCAQTRIENDGVNRSSERGPFKVIKVADGVYSAIGLNGGSGQGGAYCNPAFIIGRDYVTVVDATARPEWAKDLVAEIRKVTDKPVRYVIYLAWHVDHTGGGLGFREMFPDVQYIGQKDLREDMDKIEAPRMTYDLNATTPDLLKWAVFRVGAPAQISKLEEQLKDGVYIRESESGQIVEGPKPLDDQGRARLERQIAFAKVFQSDLPDIIRSPLPDITFEKELILHDGYRDIELRYLGPAAARGDTWVYLPKEKVLFTGDPISATPGRQDGYAENYLKVLETVNSWDWKVAIGHLGDETGWQTQANKKMLEDGISFLRDMIPQVQACVAKNMSLEQTLATVNLSSHGPKAITDGPVARYWAVLTHQRASWEGAPVLKVD